MQKEQGSVGEESWLNLRGCRSFVVWGKERRLIRLATVSRGGSAGGGTGGRAACAFALGSLADFECFLDLVLRFDFLDEDFDFLRDFPFLECLEGALEVSLSDCSFWFEELSVLNGDFS